MIKILFTFAIGFMGGTMYGVIVTAGDPTGAISTIAQLIKALF